jgi:hypothetical protein
MVRIAREQHRFMTAALGILGIACKGLVDTIAIGTGLNYRLLRQRAASIGPEEVRDWRLVWEQVKLVTDRFEKHAIPA